MLLNWPTGRLWSLEWGPLCLSEHTMGSKGEYFSWTVFVTLHHFLFCFVSWHVHYNFKADSFLHSLFLFSHLQKFLGPSRKRLNVMFPFQIDENPGGGPRRSIMDFHWSLPRELDIKAHSEQMGRAIKHVLFFYLNKEIWRWKTAGSLLPGFMPWNDHVDRVARRLRISRMA